MGMIIKTILPSFPPPCAGPSFSEDRDFWAEGVSEGEEGGDDYPEVIWPFTLDAVLELRTALRTKSC